MPTIETHICFITETLSMVTAKQLLQRDAHIVGSRLLGSGTCLNMIAASMHHRSELMGKHGLVAKCSCEPPSSCLLYTSPSPRDGLLSRMPSSA